RLHVDLDLREKRADIAGIDDLQQPVQSLPPWRERPPPPRLSSTRPARPRRCQSADDLVAREELGDLDRRRLRGIRTMHRVLADRLGVQLADRAFGRLGRIGRTHDVAMPEHRVFALQNLDHHGAGNHEIHQLAEKRTRLVHGVEGFGLLAGHANALLGDDTKSGLLDQRVDRAGQIARGRVGLDDRKGAFNRHDLVLAKLMGVAALISAPPSNGKRPQTIRRSAPADPRPQLTAWNYCNCTNMTPPCNFHPDCVQLCRASLSSTERLAVLGRCRDLTDGARWRRTRGDDHVTQILACCSCRSFACRGRVGADLRLRLWRPWRLAWWMARRPGLGRSPLFRRRPRLRLQLWLRRLLCAAIGPDAVGASLAPGKSLLLSANAPSATSRAPGLSPRGSQLGFNRVEPRPHS